MTTRSQIVKPGARIEALAASSARGRPAYVWRNSEETEQQALARHYEVCPEDRVARQTLIFQWAAGEA